MAITFDGATKRIILDSAAVTASEIWSRWVDWHASNRQWLLAMTQVGGNSLGDGTSVPPYFFMMNGWRVRPMESSHDLVITGNLRVYGGGVPVVGTLGTYQVNVNYTVPVQAQAFGSISTSDTATIAAAFLLAAQSSPIYADIRKVNNYTVTGDGHVGTEWGPV